MPIETGLRPFSRKVRAQRLQETACFPDHVTAPHARRSSNSPSRLIEGEPKNFSVLRQNGVMGVQDDITFGQGSLSRTEWRKTTDTDKAKVKAARAQVTSLLGVEKIPQVRQIITDPEARHKASQTALELIGNTYGIEPKPSGVSESPKQREERLERIAARIRGYGEVANSVITSLTEGHFSQFRNDLEMANEVKDTHDPVDLILMALDNRYDKQVRFEAKRKLVLMNLTAAIDQRERESSVDDREKQLNSFLDDYVFTQTGKIGQADAVYLHSTHDPETYACTRVEVLPREQVQGVIPQEGERYELLKRRKFQPNGHEVPIYVKTRKKDPAAKVLKLLRKGEENPALAVDDELGFMGVLDSLPDINVFLQHLRKSAVKAGSVLGEEEIKNTLKGEPHSPASAGSSPETPMYKTHLRFNGIRFEAMLHTNQSYLDYQYRVGTSHEEFEVRRLFESGVMKLLFPTDIYQYNPQVLQEAALRKVRRDIEAGV